MSYEFSPEQLKWIEALESGEYNQTQGCLKRVSSEKVSYCCLGVAMDLFDPNHFLMDMIKSLMSDNQVSKGVGLSMGVMFLLKLKSPTGVGESADYTLASLNDNGVSFKEIAKLLREKPEAYFRSTSEVST